ncbi:MAG: hypothetical protein HYS98_04630 [Deltaproteobacteria bacterium]|nr:hypothetical protein [Deltaproteobacteria bacterium]
MLAPITRFAASVNLKEPWQQKILATLSLDKTTSSFIVSQRDMVMERVLENSYFFSQPILQNDGKTVAGFIQFLLSYSSSGLDSLFHKMFLKGLFTSLFIGFIFVALLYFLVKESVLMATQGLDSFAELPIKSFFMNQIWKKFKNRYERTHEK